jgi:hypothetical protein
MPRHYQRQWRIVRAKADPSNEFISSGTKRSAKNRHEWVQRQFIDGVRDKFLQDQLFSQDSETI